MESPDASQRYSDEFRTAAREHLAHVLAADAFRTTPQLSAFLRLVVERELEGRGAELKGYTIATEALGRAADFDPQSDPIVRVEAGRLRRTLAQYYETQGRAELIRIAIPVGSYVPQISAAPSAELPADKPARPADPLPAHPLVRIGARARSGFGGPPSRLPCWLAQRFSLRCTRLRLRNKAHP